MISRRCFVSTLLASGAGTAFSLRAQEATALTAKPNVIYILCDDLGYGDVQCLNPKYGKIKTPHVDDLARKGMTFTDMHSSSSVCTPTRYGLLTGRYNWRTRLQRGVLGSFCKPLIAKDRKTVGHLFQSAGYETACIGKWHLGFEFTQRTKENPAPKGQIAKHIDYAAPVLEGPITRGFDYYYGRNIAGGPFIMIENDRVVNGDNMTVKTILGRGDATKDFEAEDVLPKLIDKAKFFVRKTRDKPFFLYLPLTSPHTPISPSKSWQGKSGINPYADFVMETDAGVGQIVKTLKEIGQLDNTLIIFTSDNGHAHTVSGLPKLTKVGHQPSVTYRGYKADIWEGGHRVPFIAYWTGKIKPGTTCDQPLSLVDFMATAAELLGQKLPNDAGEDSFSFLPVLMGVSDKAVRETLVCHSIHGMFALRTKEWKFIYCPASGGWSIPRDNKSIAPRIQLYNMVTDWRETTNVQDKHPDIVKDLTAKLVKIVQDGRSIPGPKQRNDAPIIIDKVYSKKRYMPNGTIQEPPKKGR